MQSIQIVPEGPFSEIPRSDTLFGAICWGLKRSRGEEALEDLLARFADGKPPFLLSSAFPTVEDEHGERRHLLPKPRLPGPRSGGEAASDVRIEAMQAWKRIEYIPAELLAALATGERSGSDVIDGLESSAVRIDGRDHERVREFLLPADGDRTRRPYETTGRVRNAVNRLTSATDNLFERESVFFREGTGLHVALDGETEIAIEALAMLQDRGIGGGKSVGQGQFRLDGCEELDVPSAADSAWFCTLSLCVPRAEELGELVEEGFYEVETRKGVVENAATAPASIWKRRVLALAEGSVLPRGGATHGHNPVVADHFEHGVQHYGYALPIGFER